MRSATSARPAQVSLAGLLKKHGLTQQDVATGSGLAVSAVNDLVNERRCPTTGTVNKLLAYLRQFEPRIGYDDLFA